LKLLEEVDIGYVYSSNRIQTRRAVTVPADLNEKDTAAMNASILLDLGFPEGAEAYQALSSTFYNKG